MATILEKFIVSVILDAKGFKDGANEVEEGVDRAEKATKKAETTAKSAEKAYADLGDRWAKTLRGVVLNIAAPITAATAIFKSITGYASQVAEVAQMTGGYSRQLEEWRLKRAALSRVTREDIELYAKSREAVVGFQIAMGDLSAKIARQFSPALEWGVDLLDRLTQWIDRNSDNLARFFAIAGTAITAFFLPALAKMGLALATNPITWLVAGLTTLILLIDDLTVYMRGGQSALSEFWGIFGTGEELSKALNDGLTFLKETFAEFQPLLKTMGGSLLALFAGGSALLVLLRSVIGISRGALGAFRALGGGALWLYRAFSGLIIQIPLLLSVMRTSFMVSAQLFMTAGSFIVRAFAGGFGWLIRTVPVAAALISKGLVSAFALLGKVAMGVLTAITAHPIIALIVAVTAAVYGFFKAWENGGGTLSGMLDYLRGLLADFVGDWGILGDAILAAFDFVADGIEWLADFISNLPQYAADAVAGITAWFGGLVDDVSSVFSSVTDSIKDAFNRAVDVVKSIFSGLWEWIKDLFDFSDLINGALDKVKGLGKGIVEGAKDMLGLGDDEEDEDHAEDAAFDTGAHGAEAVRAPRTVRNETAPEGYPGETAGDTAYRQEVVNAPGMAGDENTPAESRSENTYRTEVTHDRETVREYRERTLTDNGGNAPAEVKAPSPVIEERRNATAVPDITNNVTVITEQPEQTPQEAPAQPYSNGLAQWAQNYETANPAPVANGPTSYTNAYYSNVAATSSYDNSQRTSTMTQNNTINVSTGSSNANEVARAVDGVLSRRSADYSRSVMAVETGTRI